MARKNQEQLTNPQINKILPTLVEEFQTLATTGKAYHYEEYTAWNNQTTKATLRILPFNITSSGAVRGNLSYTNQPSGFHSWWHDKVGKSPWSTDTKILEQFFSLVDKKSLRENYINENKAEIDKLKVKAKLNREKRETKKTEEVDFPIPLGVECRLPEKVAKEILWDNPKLILQFIEQPSWLQIAALSRGATNLKYIKEPTQEALEFVAKNSMSGISKIPAKLLTDEFKAISIKEHNGSNLSYIRGLTDELKLLAISLNSNAINQVRGVTDKMKRLHEMKWKI